MEAVQGGTKCVIEVEWHGLAMALSIFLVLNGWAQVAPADVTDSKVFAFNDLGMHCYDNDFSVFSLLPPFNVIHSQVVARGLKPILLNDTQITLTYAATHDPRLSINSTSINKTNFWDFIAKLFGVSRPLDTGILGYKMPSATSGPQPLSYEAGFQWFTAAGIPLTNIDDAGKINSFPMMKIQALSKNTGAALSSLDIVVPVSSEMNCAACHETDAFVASNPGSASDASPPPRIGPPP